MFYTVYKTTNTIDGKFYIGVHQTNNINDDYLGSGTRLHLAIKKYGPTVFSKEILFICSSSEEAFNKEKELITEELIKSNNCYNMKPGGNGGWTLEAAKLGALAIVEKRKQNEEFNLQWLEKFRQATNLAVQVIKQKYPNGSWFGKVHREETKKKIGLSNSIIQSGSGNSQYGTKWITDGISNKKIKKDQEIPSGWRSGRIRAIAQGEPAAL